MRPSRFPFALRDVLVPLIIVAALLFACIWVVLTLGLGRPRTVYVEVTQLFPTNPPVQSGGVIVPSVTPPDPIGTAPSLIGTPPPIACSELGFLGGFSFTDQRTLRIEIPNPTAATIPVARVTLTIRNYVNRVAPQVVTIHTVTNGANFQIFAPTPPGSFPLTLSEAPIFTLPPHTPVTLLIRFTTQSGDVQQHYQSSDFGIEVVSQLGSDGPYCLISLPYR